MCLVFSMQTQWSAINIKSINRLNLLLLSGCRAAFLDSIWCASVCVCVYYRVKYVRKMQNAAHFIILHGINMRIFMILAIPSAYCSHHTAILNYSMAVIRIIKPWFECGCTFKCIGYTSESGTVFERKKK